MSIKHTELQDSYSDLIGLAELIRDFIQDLQIEPLYERRLWRYGGEEYTEIDLESIHSYKDILTKLNEIDP